MNFPQFMVAYSLSCDKFYFGYYVVSSSPVFSFLLSQVKVTVELTENMYIPVHLWIIVVTLFIPSNRCLYCSTQKRLKEIYLRDFACGHLSATCRCPGLGKSPTENIWDASSDMLAVLHMHQLALPISLHQGGKPKARKSPTVLPLGKRPSNTNSRTSPVFMTGLQKRVKMKNSSLLWIDPTSTVWVKKMYLIYNRSAIFNS